MATTNHYAGGASQGKGATATLPNYLPAGLCIETISPESRYHHETPVVYGRIPDIAGAVPSGDFQCLNLLQHYSRLSAPAFSWLMPSNPILAEIESRETKRSIFAAFKDSDSAAKRCQDGFRWSRCEAFANFKLSP
jgi:hypothetical protein